MIRKKIPSVLAGVCLAIYILALGFTAFRLYMGAQDQARLAQEEFFDLADQTRGIATLDPLMGEYFQGELHDKLNRSRTLQGVIISGPSGEIPFERIGGRYITMMGDSPRFRERLGVVREPLFTRLLITTGTTQLRNVTISAVWDVVDYIRLLEILKQSLFFILIPLGLSLITLLYVSIPNTSAELRARGAGRDGGDDPPPDPGEAEGGSAQKAASALSDQSAPDEPARWFVGTPYGGLPAAEDDFSLEELPVDEDLPMDEDLPLEEDLPVEDDLLLDEELPAEEELPLDEAPGPEESADLADLAETSDSAAEAVPDADGEVEEDTPELEDAPLFPPRSTVGRESDAYDRLNEELQGDAEDDLVYLAMEMRQPVSEEDYQALAEEAADYFKNRDLIFERGMQGFSVILPKVNLDQGLVQAEQFRSLALDRLSGEERRFADSDLCMGLSSRAGRLLDADRIGLEAAEALRRAGEDDETALFAFRADPEKYKALFAGREAAKNA
jgi:hypothetical protein